MLQKRFPINIEINFENLSGGGMNDYNNAVAASTGQSQNSGGSQALEFGTAVFNAIGQVSHLVDSNGNHVPVDHIDEMQTTDDGDNTMQYILIAIAAVIAILVLMIILKKKA